MWWAGAVVVTAAAVGTTSALGIAVHRTYDGLEHAPAYSVPAPTPVLSPAPVPGALADAPALASRLDSISTDPALGTLGAQVIDTATGEVVWSKNADRPLLPASSTKLLTVAAATWELPADHRITTRVMRAPGEGGDTVIIKAAGDVWLTSKKLDELAAQISNDNNSISTVLIDTSIWGGPDQAPGWDPDNVDGGYVAPMQPAMLYGGRLGKTTGDVPRSHNPALDVASALARRLGAPNVGLGPVPEGAVEVASISSAPLAQRAEEMIKQSDNVAAEAVARELAAFRQGESGPPVGFEQAIDTTMAVLNEHGLNTDGVEIWDNSGLSENNRIPAAVLANLLATAVSDASLRDVLGYLPVAGGTGTLYERYADLSGRGYVRAKTGTLTGTSALAGTAVARDGRVFAFAFLVNDGDILGARAAQDELATALHEAGG